MSALVRDAVEARLPIPSDVLVTTRGDLPSGNAWWVPQHRVILVREDLAGAERNVVLAHETAHILLGHHADLYDEHPRGCAGIEGEADGLGDLLLLGAATAPGLRRAIRRAIATRDARRVS